MTERLYLEARDPGWVSMTHALPVGAAVTVMISGDVGVWRGWRSGIDAAYCHQCPPGTHYSPFPKPHRTLHIQTNYGPYNPAGGYQPSHVYHGNFVGNGSPMSFHFSDDANQSDNSGGFSIVVSW